MSKQLGFKIKTARRKLNISQGDLSKKLEILAKEGSFAKSGHAVVRLEEIVVQRIHQNIFCAIHFSLH